VYASPFTLGLCLITSLLLMSNRKVFLVAMDVTLALAVVTI